MKFPLFLLSVLFLFALISCMEEQDFSQLNDIEITPAVEISVFNFEIPEKLINHNPRNFYTNNSNFNVFGNTNFSDKVIEGSITYQLENTTSKPILFTIKLLDNNGKTLDTTILNIKPEAKNTTDKEIFYGGAGGKSLNIIRNTSAIGLSAENLGDNTSVSSQPNPKLILRASAKVKISIQ